MFCNITILQNICFSQSLDPYNIFQTRLPDRDLPEEVRALEVFLQKTGGPYGGWDQYDHQAFLKVRHYCQLLSVFYFTQPQVRIKIKSWQFGLNSNLFYLQVWTKHSGQPAYRKEAKLYLPGKTLEEIEQHEEWHQELICLQDRKREVV